MGSTIENIRGNERASNSLLIINLTNHLNRDQTNQIIQYFKPYINKLLDQ